MPERRAAARRARGSHLRRRGARVLMAIALDALEAVREKVEAGDRLDFEDGLALAESDDLLALGELPHPPRRQRGGTHDGYFRPNPHLKPPNVYPLKCNFL